MSNPEVEAAAEQAYLDRAEACLAVMREHAARNVELGAIRAREEPSADTSLLLQELERRHAALAESPVALAFGRLDEACGERFYVGRRHVEDSAGDPVVVDWRADVSVPFYRATWADPMGLDLRRRFALDGRRLLGCFDENFGADAPDGASSGGGGVPDPLLAELERGRTAEMRDIVATIQAEQDEVIRAPLGECLVVQGGPGTGKTAVGLHRAAFLLYEHRQELERERLLVVGPNRLFLRYIAQVLPSLGETAVTQTTLAGLLERRLRVHESDPPAVAAIKGDARMARVIERAARSPLATSVSEELLVQLPSLSLRLPTGDVQRVLDGVHARRLPLQDAREQLRARLARLALDRATELRPSTDEQELVLAVRRDREFRAAVDRLWPVPSAPALVRRLLGDRRALAAAAHGVLDGDEQATLYRKPSRKLSEERWTLADLALVDEAEALISGAPRGFGHIVVDEAQDHTAMELRALARRVSTRSMTILGDLAQASGVGGQSSWAAVLEVLDSPYGRVAELELGYRVPAPVLEFANRLLPEAAPGIRPSRSVRAGGAPPVIVECAAEADLATATANVVAAERVEERSVGVVAPEPLLDGIADALESRGVPFTDGRRAVGLDAAVTIVPPEAAKGLEFDAVIVVEPARIAQGDAIKLRLLYIALTRAVRTLTLVHAAPLPEPLR